MTPSINLIIILSVTGNKLQSIKDSHYQISIVTYQTELVYGRNKRADQPCDILRDILVLPSLYTRIDKCE